MIMPRKQVLAKKRSSEIPYGKLTEDRYTFMVYGFDFDCCPSSWSDEGEPLECWKLNKDKIMDRWFRGYRTHYGIRPVGFWQYEKGMKRPDIDVQRKLLREWGELTEREIAELAKQEQKQPDAESVQVPNGTIDNDDQELKK